MNSRAHPHLDVRNGRKAKADAPLLPADERLGAQPVRAVAVQPHRAAALAELLPRVRREVDDLEVGRVVLPNPDHRHHIMHPIPVHVPDVDRRRPHLVCLAGHRRDPPDRPHRLRGPGLHLEEVGAVHPPFVRRMQHVARAGPELVDPVPVDVLDGGLRVDWKEVGERGVAWVCVCMWTRARIDR